MNLQQTNYKSIFDTIEDRSDVAMHFKWLRISTDPIPVEYYPPRNPQEDILFEGELFSRKTTVHEVTYKPCNYILTRNALIKLCV
jgi:hypothetical protein